MWRALPLLLLWTLAWPASYEHLVDVPAEARSHSLPAGVSGCFVMTVTARCTGATQAAESTASNVACRQAPVSLQWVQPLECEGGAAIAELERFTIYRRIEAPAPDPELEPIPAAPIVSLRAIGERADMALTPTHLTHGTSTTSPASTASVAVPDGGVVYVAVAAAQAPGPVNSPTASVGGLGLTWALVQAKQAYATRRSLHVFRAVNETGSQVSGQLTVGATGNGQTLQEFHWSADLFAGADLASPNDTPVSGQTAGTVLTLALADVGTPDAGDLIYSAFGFEDGADNFALDGATVLGSVTGGTNVRTLVTGYGSDETPSASWDSAGNNAGGIAFIVNAAAGGVELTVADASHGHTTGNIDLVQGHILSVDSALHGQTADSVALTQSNLLSVADASHAHSADALELTQAHVLTVAEALHGHSADAIVLTQAGTLSVADALHSHLVDGLTLTTAGTLAVADATHGHTADALALTQAHVLSVADSLHSHLVDAVELGLGLVLTIEDALHAHSADEVALTQAHILAVSSALHGHAADQVTLSQSVVLVPADALHGHTAEALTLSQAQFLGIQDALHAQLADTPSLIQAGVLVVSDALHAHFAGNITIPGTVFQTDRLIVVRATDRILVVSPADRIIATRH